ncbi:hypothetical protein ACWDAG_45735 [Streptomyces sp. NPDC001157]
MGKFHAQESTAGCAPDGRVRAGRGRGGAGIGQAEAVPGLNIGSHKYGNLQYGSNDYKVGRHYWETNS